MTVKEQCLEKIQDYIDDCDEYKDTEHRYAALVLAIVKRDIELNIEEPAAAHNYAVILEHPEEMPVISKDKIEQFKEELNEAQYIIYDKFGMPKQKITFEKEGVVN